MIEWSAALLPPLFVLLAFIFFIRHLWNRLDSLPKKTGSTQELSERIYSNFEFFIKIFLALVAGFGYVKFTYGSTQANVARQALLMIGGIGMIAMVALVLSVASIQGWKIPRWNPVDWSYVWTWQEIYMMLAMYLLASGLWIAAILW